MDSTATSLGQGQRAVLRALVDTFLPPIAVDKKEAESEEARQFWETRLSADDDYMKTLETALTVKIAPPDRFLTRMLLSALSTSVGVSLLFGVPSLSAFPDLPEEKRVTLLQGLRDSSIQSRRQAFIGLKRLICGLAFSFTDSEGKNPFWKYANYPGPFQGTTSAEEDNARVQAAMKEHKPIREAILPTIEQDTVLECDFVIVGSGAGGCVSARNLSKAGYDVLVLEKGVYYSPEEVTNKEADGFDRMYENHSFLTTSDGNIFILAGSTLGGGTQINWSCCLPLPKYVMAEWVSVFGLDDFRPDGYFQQMQETVMTMMGASDTSKVQHNTMNSMFRDACTALGYHWEATGQNARNLKDDSNGYFCLGDRYAARNNGVTTFLAEAVRHKTKIIDKCRVERVVTACRKSTDYRRRAVGVECLVNEQYRLSIRSRKGVILSAGALQTPCILQRSGLRNKHIGKNLRLHPCSGSFGFLRSPVCGSMGSPMTAVCNEIAMGPNNDGYGAKIECPSAHFGLLGGNATWVDPKNFKETMAKFSNAAAFIALQRDTGSGSVVVGSDGKSLKIDYKVSQADNESLVIGKEYCLKLLLAMGCHEIWTAHSRDRSFKWDETKVAQNPAIVANDPAVKEHLATIRSHGMKPLDSMIFSAHQMGTCRMSTSPSVGAADVNGELWECDDLYVMDTSLFPTASGANPMMTVTALAFMQSQKLAMRTQYLDGSLAQEADIKSTKQLVQHRMDLRGMRKSQEKFVRTSELVARVAGVSSVLLPLVGAFVLDTPSFLAAFR